MAAKMFGLLADGKNWVPIRVDADGKVVISNPGGGGGGGGAAGGLGATLWVDADGDYFLRRDITDPDDGSISVQWTTPSGTVATPVEPIKPASTAEDIEVTNSQFVANTTGTGYNTGDVIVRSIAMDNGGDTPVIVAASWLNVYSGAIIAAPVTAHLDPAGDNAELLQAIADLETAASTDKALASKQDVIAERLGAVDEAKFTGSGTSGIRGILYGLYDMWAAFFALTAAAIVDVTHVGGTAVSKTVGLFMRKTVSKAWTKTVSESGELIEAGTRVLCSYFICNPDDADRLYVRFFNAATKEAVVLASNPTTGWVIVLDAGEKANVSDLELDFPAGLVVFATKDLTGAVAPTTPAIVSVGHRSSANGG